MGLPKDALPHYVIPAGERAGEHRPAIIVRVINKLDGQVNLQVFTDGPNDTEDAYGKDVTWMGTVDFSEDPKPRTWHWIEKA